MGKGRSHKHVEENKLKTNVSFLHPRSDIKMFYLNCNTFGKYHSLKEHREFGTKALNVQISSVSTAENLKAKKAGVPTSDTQLSGL